MTSATWNIFIEKYKTRGSHSFSHLCKWDLNSPLPSHLILPAYPKITSQSAPCLNLSLQSEQLHKGRDRNITKEQLLRLNRRSDKNAWCMFSAHKTSSSEMGWIQEMRCHSCDHQYCVVVRVSDLGSGILRFQSSLCHGSFLGDHFLLAWLESWAWNGAEEDTVSCSGSLLKRKVGCTWSKQITRNERQWEEIFKSMIRTQNKQANTTKMFCFLHFKAAAKVPTY